MKEFYSYTDYYKISISNVSLYNSLYRNDNIVYIENMNKINIPGRILCSDYDENIFLDTWKIYNVSRSLIVPVKIDIDNLNVYKKNMKILACKNHFVFNVNNYIYLYNVNNITNPTYSKLLLPINYNLNKYNWNIIYDNKNTFYISTFDSDNTVYVFPSNNLNNFYKYHLNYKILTISNDESFNIRCLIYKYDRLHYYIFQVNIYDEWTLNEDKKFSDDCDQIYNINYFIITNNMQTLVQNITFRTNEYIYIINGYNIYGYYLQNSYEIVNFGCLSLKNDNRYIIITKELIRYDFYAPEDMAYVIKVGTKWYYNTLTGAGVSSIDDEDYISSVDVKFNYMLYYNMLKRFYNNDYLNKLLSFGNDHNINHMLKYYD